jgi:hypothetical protein
MNKRFIFFIFILLSLAALIFHIKEMIWPGGSTPLWRHIFFALVNCICIYGITKRPAWFIWFTALLTLQQWYSHGSYAVTIWQQQKTIDWISIGIILLLPLLFILLLLEKKENKSS